MNGKEAVMSIASKAGLIVAVFGAAALIASAAEGGDGHGHGKRWREPPVYVVEQPVIVRQAPVYVAPPPVVYSPAPMYSDPVYVAPSPGININIPLR
jgi:hypothetical protein